MENFSTRRWTTVPAPSVSYSVHEVKKIASVASASFLNLIYHGTSMVAHLLLLKSSMVHVIIVYYLPTYIVIRQSRALTLWDFICAEDSKRFGLDNAVMTCNHHPCGQSYKRLTIVIYDSRLIMARHLQSVVFEDCWEFFGSTTDVKKLNS